METTTAETSPEWGRKAPIILLKIRRCDISSIESEYLQNHDDDYNGSDDVQDIVHAHNSFPPRSEYTAASKKRTTTNYECYPKVCDVLLASSPGTMPSFRIL
jgi:hypothetical protein